MKLARLPHRWNVTPKEAVAIQLRLASRVLQTPSRKRFRLVAGVDAAFSRDGEQCIAGVVLWDVGRREVVEEHVATRLLTFPYVPGLLSFREAPAVIAALRKLRRTPEIVFCDGHGLAHPRRFGIACHLGVLLDLPAVGCGKTRLIGEHRLPAHRRGSRTLLKSQGETIGAVLRTRDGVRPIFVSVGHRIDLASAARIVLRTAIGFRLPEPVRRADRLVAAFKRCALTGR